MLKLKIDIIDNYIYINKEFLNSDEMYVFGDLRDITGRKLKTSKEIIVLINNN